MNRILIALFYTLVPAYVMGLLLLGVFALVGYGIDWDFLRLMTGFTLVVGAMHGIAEATLPD